MMWDDECGGQQILSFLLQNYWQMKSREGSPGRSKKQCSSRPKGDLTQHYLSEILKSIEDLQSTILRKLDQPHPNRPHPYTSRSIHPPCSNYTPSIKSKGKTSLIKSPTAYNTQRCYTSRDYTSTPKITHFQTAPPPQPLTAITPPTPTVTLNFTPVKQKQQPSLSVSKVQGITDIPLPKGKQNKISVKTQRDEPILRRNQLSGRKYDIQIIDHPPPVSPQAPQQFYRREIERLQVEERIRQLEDELEQCLYNKRASKPAEFSFLRTKMKRISLELVQLRDQQNALRQ